MEAKPLKDSTADKKSHILPTRWSEREIGLVSKVMEELKFPSVSETIRESTIVGMRELLRRKGIQLDPEMMAYIDARDAKLKTDFSAYRLTTAGVEQERLASVEDLCRWYYDRSNHGSKKEMLVAILETIEEAKRNLQIPQLGEGARNALLAFLDGLEEEYKRRFAENVVTMEEEKS